MSNRYLGASSTYANVYVDRVGPKVFLSGSNSTFLHKDVPLVLHVDRRVGLTVSGRS